MERRLANRLVVCGLALCLLWATSLQMSVALVGGWAGFATPSFEVVLAQCADEGFGVADVQRQEYTACAQIETQQCEALGVASFVAEGRRAQKAQDQDNAVLALLQRWQANCSSLHDEAQIAVSAWAASFEASATLHDDAAAAACAATLLHSPTSAPSPRPPTASPTRQQPDPAAYSRLSDSTVAHLASYSVELSDYNSQYLANKTKSLRLLASGLVEGALTALPDATGPPLASLQLSMDGLLACIALGDFSSSDSNSSASSTTSSSCSLESSSMRELYAQVEASVRGQLDYLASTLSEFSSDYAAFKADLEAGLAAADAFYDSIAGASGLLRWILDNFDVFHAADELCGKSTPDWCQLGKADWARLVVQMPRAPSADLVSSLPGAPSAQVLWAQMQPAVDDARLAMQQAADQAQAAAEDAVSAALDSINADPAFNVVPPADYQPPQYPYAANASAESARHRQASEQFLVGWQDWANSSAAAARHARNASAAAAAAASAGTSTKQAAKQAGASAASTIAGAPAALQRYASSAVLALWSSFSNPSSDLLRQMGAWLAAFLSLQGLLLLFDYLYRALQTVRTVARFWGRSLGRLPSADIQVKRGDKHPTTAPGPHAAALQVLPYVWLQLALLAALAALVLGSLAALYLGAFGNYVDACVQGRANSSTLLGRNAYSAAFNYASFDGNAVVATAAQAFDARWLAAGAAAETASAKEWRAVRGQALAANASLALGLSGLRGLQARCAPGPAAGAGAGAGLGLLPRVQQWAAGLCSSSGSSSAAAVDVASACVWAAALKPSALLSTCPPLAPAPSSSAAAAAAPGRAAATAFAAALAFSRGSASASAQASTQPQAQSQSQPEALFRPSAIPPCTIACAGPSAPLLAQAAQACACTVEWAAHSRLWQAALVALVYISINTARAALLEAVLVLLWAALNAPVFTVAVSSSRAGRLLVQDEEGGRVRVLGKARGGGGGGAVGPTAGKGGVGGGRGQGKDDLARRRQQALIRGALNRGMLRYAAKGWALLALSAAVNVPWAVLLWYLRDNVQYRPHAQDPIE